MIKPILLIAMTAMFVLFNSSCENLGRSGESPEKVSEFVFIEGQKFKDPYGRDLILHVINVVNKNPASGYVGHITPDDMATFKSWGFNVIRLGIIWDGLEPEPGKYNEAYLQKIDEMIGWAADNNLYVFLDMHQDLYARMFSDGAPDWATITDGLPHETGAIWSDAYLISPAVQTAFDHFWNNSPAPDGIGIQDHYINLWQHITERYADNKTVIGYDIMNEPFMGSGARQVMPLLLGGFAKILVEKTGQAPPSEEALMYMWSAERVQVFELLSEKEVYRKLIDSIYELNASFERGTLTAFFQKARDAIRKVDQNHIIFTEHSYFTNMGVTGALGEIVDENGIKDPLVAYAAHGYDLVVDTEGLTSGSNDRVELIFERIAETGKRLDVPVLIGEWGALHGNSPDLVPIANYLMQLFNKHKFSDAFWAYYRSLESTVFVEALKKAYPVHTSGSLQEYSYDFDTRSFSCKWTENKDVIAPTVIYIPEIENLQHDQITISPEAGRLETEGLNNSGAGYLIIQATGKNATRTLKFSLKGAASD